NLHIPDHALDGPQLLAADAVFSAGGTMAREAAVLGTPAYSLFAGERPAVDELLVREGRRTILRTHEDIEHVTVSRTTRRGDFLARTDDLVKEVAGLLVDFPG